MLRKIHHVIFGTDISERMLEFLGYLSVSFVGITLASLIILPVQIFAGRLMGPVEYGKYGLVMAIAQIMIIGMLPGWDTAIIRHVALFYHDIDKSRQVVDTGILALIFTIMATVVLLLLFLPLYSRALHIESGIFIAAIIYAAVLAIKNVGDAIARGFHQFKRQALAKVIEAVMVAVLFAVLFWRGESRGYQAFVAVLVGGTLALVLFYFISGRKQKMDFTSSSWNELRQMWRYAKYGVVGAIGGLCVISIDRIFIQRFLGSYELGIYLAYYNVSVMIASQLGTIIINVLFPMAAKEKNRAALLRKIDRLWLATALPAIVGGTIIILGLIRLFGTAYSLNVGLAMLMSVFAFLNVSLVVYINLIASAGPSGISFSVKQQMIFGMIYLFIVAVFLLSGAGIYAPPVAFIISFLYLVGVRFSLTEQKTFAMNS